MYIDTRVSRGGTAHSRTHPTDAGVALTLPIPCPLPSISGSTSECITTHRLALGSQFWALPRFIVGESHVLRDLTQVEWSSQGEIVSDLDRRTRFRGDGGGVKERGPIS